MDILQIKNLHFTYPQQETEALCGVDLSIADGGYYLLCGSSGSGKSTLLRHLKTEIAPHGTTRGEILYKRERLGSVPRERQACEIGFVFQNPDTQLVTDKVWHELAFGLESVGVRNEEMHLRIAELAAYFGITGWLDKKVAELSGGQKQLLNLASVMALHPKVLLLDEPTAQLAPTAAVSFLDTVDKIHTELGVTVLLTEHRTDDVMPRVSRVVLMEEGRITAQGTPAQIGAFLIRENSSFLQAMPAPTRIYAGVGGSGDCPYDVLSGKQWLGRELVGRAERNGAREGCVKEETPEALSKENIKTTSTSGKKAAKPFLRLRDVSFAYDKSQPEVLRGLSLDILPGEVFAFLGGNGTGKSTALKLIAGIYAADSGKIYLDGKRIAQYSNQALYRGLVGYLPQDVTTVFSARSVEEELRSVERDAAQRGGFEGNNSTDTARYQTVVDNLSLAPLLKRHPYDLSGGEQQKAALAKILLLRPRLLLLDEPTKGMDAMLKQEFGMTLRALSMAGVTCILVSHDTEFCAAYADRVGLFFDGRLTGVQDARRFFAGNFFYTTPTNRMVRGFFPEAVTTEDAVRAIKGGSIKPKQADRFDITAMEINEENDEPKDRDSIAKTEESIAEPPAEHGRKEKRFFGHFFLLSLFFVVPFFLWCGTVLFDGRYYLAVSLCIALYAALFPLLRFGRGRPRGQHIAVLAVLTALAVIGRAVFYMFPSIKPTAAVVIVAGAGLGAESGFLVGALAMLVSNMLFSQGMWTPWQMAAMGMVGLFAGLVFFQRKKIVHCASLCLYGFLSVLVLYGMTVDLASLAMLSYSFNAQNVKAILLSGFPMNLVHAASTTFLLLLAGKPMLEKLARVRDKMGL